MNTILHFRTRSVQRLGTLTLAILFLGPAVIGSGFAQELAVYPSYRPTWDATTETFSLKSSVFVLNTGEAELKDLAFYQSFPEPLAPTLLELTPEEKDRLPDGFMEKIDGRTYQMRISTLRPQEGALIQNEVPLRPRLGEKEFPGLRVEYNLSEEREEVRLADHTYDLTAYADHVGDLERFLKKRCKISLDLTSGPRKIWEFAGRDAAATGSNPTGVLGVVVKAEKQGYYEGYYRLRSGSPGDLLEILVVWRPIRKRHREDLTTKEAKKTMVERLEDYTKWVGNYRFDRSSLRLTKKDFLDYEDTLFLEGRWTDQVANRLGEGPFRWIVLYSTRIQVEFSILLMAQGRGLGADASKTPQPDKEEALMQELDKYARTFKSGIIPLSYK